MGRRPKVASDGDATSTTGATPVRRTRRRTVDHVEQGKVLVASLLTSRGDRGATEAEALAVVMWAQGVHAEAADLKTLATRVRRARAENAAERQAALTVKQNLLDNVLLGTLRIDVDEAGAITFSAA